MVRLAEDSAMFKIAQFRR